MKLGQLDPQFVQYFEDASGSYLRCVPDLVQAQGIRFLCPACFVRNGGNVGTHYIETSFAGRDVKDHQGSHNRSGKPSRWTVYGSGYSDLTLSPSVLIYAAEPACPGWHGWVKFGEVK